MAYSRKDVTTYMHILVYHYGEFLEKYGGIEKFANYALESKHSIMKRILAGCTSGFSRGPAELVRQELRMLIRLEKHEERERKEKESAEGESEVRAATSQHTRSHKTRTPRDWASASLAVYSAIEAFVVNSTIT
jgi:hypothetical protein